MTTRNFRPVAAAIGMTIGICLAVPAWSQQDAGAYLAARAASSEQDYAASEKYFAEALRADPDNPILLDSVLAARIGLGEFDAAERPANRLVELGIESQLAHLVRQVTAIEDGDWSAVLSRIEAGEEIGPLVDGLAQAWSLVGNGQMTDAIRTFDGVIEARGLRAFGLYHKAIALSSVGDLEGAEAILALPPTQGMQRTRRSTIAQIEVLSRLDRNADAVALIDAVFGTDPDAAIADLRRRLEAGETLPVTIAPNAAAGMAEAYLSVAGALDGETADSYTLIYARASLALRPADSDTVLLTGELLDRMGRFAMSEATYRLIDQSNPAFPTAELGRSEVLRKDGRIEAATEVLFALSRAFPDNPNIKVSLGNLLRETGRLPEAITAYSRALELYPEGEPMVWLTHYMRGIALHRTDSWEEAEADFRAALMLEPRQPQVLNYLGYSLVERQEKLDEALEMIEAAVAQRPENGAIVDSLGWVLFRLGQYDEAVTHLERATELEPMESVINDHLGDAYWAVGRLTEAQFQWNRALSLNPEEKEAIRLRDKLELGLDAVLARDGEQPLIQVADDEG